MFWRKLIRVYDLENILYGYLGKTFGFSDNLFAHMKAGTSEEDFGKFYGLFLYRDDLKDQKYNI